MTPMWRCFQSLEEMDYDAKGKMEVAALSDMFTRRKISTTVRRVHADSALDALTASLSEKGRIDMGYMESLTGKNETEALTTEMGESGF